VLTIADAAAHLAAGHLLAFPTETVYGLGADAANPAAVAKIFAAKGRPTDHPLIVHVLDAHAATHFAQSIPDFAQRLIQAFWPGPLTIIVKRQSAKAQACTGGQDSIGLRCPAHPLAQELLQACAQLGLHGLAAPSANQFGKISPTTAAHVRQEFGPDLPILDGGACQVGIESTIIDCSRGAPVLLRPGVLTQQAIEAALGQSLHGSHSPLSQTTPRASGTLASHYAPRAPVRLMDSASLQTALDLLGPDAKNIAIYTRSALKIHAAQLIVRRMPSDAHTAAQQLFATLRDFDTQGARLIWIETVPAHPDWDGVRDRLQRAAA